MIIYLLDHSLCKTHPLCMVPVRRQRHAKLPDFDEAHKSTWHNLEVNERSHFLFNYSNHWPLPISRFAFRESKWQILFLLLPHETFQVILARGHQWWSWWAPETHGNCCILQKEELCLVPSFKGPVIPSPDREHALPYYSWVTLPGCLEIFERTCPLRAPKVTLALGAGFLSLCRLRHLEFSSWGLF